MRAISAKLILYFCHERGTIKHDEGWRPQDTFRPMFRNRNSFSCSHLPILYFSTTYRFFPGLSMSKEQEYDPLISDPADEFEHSSAPVKLTWTSKFSRTVLVSLLAAETVALAIAIFAIFARGPYTTCIVPFGSQGVLYCGFLSVF
jgi:hypothetical protein